MPLNCPEVTTYSLKALASIFLSPRGFRSESEAEIIFPCDADPDVPGVPSVSLMTASGPRPPTVIRGSCTGAIGGASPSTTPKCRICLGQGTARVACDGTREGTGCAGAPDVHCELSSGTSCFRAHVLGPDGGAKPCGMALAGKALSSWRGHLEAPGDVESSHPC